MSRFAAFVCVLVLAGCGGGGGGPSVPPPVAPAGTLFVANADGINVFPAAASGTAVPQRQITGLYKLNPGANGGTGQGYSSQYVNAIAAGTTSGTVAALVVSVAHLQAPGFVVNQYGPTANGNSPPQSVGFPVPNFDLGLAPAHAIAAVPGASGYDVVGGPYYVERTSPPSVFRNADAQLVFTAESCIALDAAGNVYVSTYPGKVAVYAAGATGDATPIRTITTAAYPKSLAIGPDGTLYVAEQLTSPPPFALATFTIEEYAPGASSAARVLGPFTPDRYVVSIAVDAQSELYVAQAQNENLVFTGNGTIAVFAPGASGTAAPVRTLQNPIPNMVAIAVGP